MKFLLISKYGEGAQLLFNIKEEGNDCRMYIKTPEYRTAWKGLLDQVNLNSSWIDKETVVIFDFSGMGKLADQFKKTNPVFGASSWADELEENRMFGLRTMEACGIQYPETKEFTVRDWSKAEAFINAHKDKRYVFKPSGENLPCKLTYSSSDAVDLLKYLDFIKAFYISEIESFVLQEFIEGHIVSSEFWCDGKKFVDPPNHTVEVKKFMNDDKGPSTGCSGNVVWICDMDDIILDGVARVEELCIKHGYVGCIDLNTICTEKGPFGLEWTPRFGYDAMPTFLQLVNQDLGELFSDFARGNGRMRLHDCYAGGARVSIPPYPLETESIANVRKVSQNLGLPIRGFPESAKPNTYFFEIMKQGDEIVHSEGTGLIACISDVGDTPEETLEFPMHVLDEIKIPDKQYRTDLSKVLSKMVKEIKGKEIYA